MRKNMGLYRGKRKDNGEWVVGIYSPYNWNFMGERESKPQIIKLSDDYSDGLWCEVIPETVGECTGLTDKNGKKIFEGDIFKFSDEIWESSYTSCGTEWDSWKCENFGVVGFDECSARYDFVQYKYHENSVEADLHENNVLEFSCFVNGLEIIGNIHDNPEMLESEDNERRMNDYE